MRLLIAVLASCTLLAAQEPKPKTGGTVSPEFLQPKPAIPDSHAAEYFAAAAAVARIDAAYKQAQAALEAAKSKVIADCGSNATPNEGVAGKMVCDVKPEAPKAASPAPAK